jgi:predicted acetyltransferase
MPQLQIEFLHITQISPELDREIDALDHLAFSADENDDPEFNAIEWSAQEWMALGRLDGQLVSQLCLLKREILVGGEKVTVAGIGGVATHPQWQRQGLASQIMRATETFLRDEICVPFGLLVCAEQTQPVYARCGWQTVANALFFVQNDQRLPLYTCVMVLPLSGQPWPSGEIDLCGLPW